MTIYLPLLGLLTLGAAVAPAAPGSARSDGPQLAHIVFFELVDDSVAAREKLVAACKEQLSGHEGTVYFSVGARAEKLAREVNDGDFHVALHLVFRNEAAHDEYQKHPRHLKFIEDNEDSWKKVRVFDSYLSSS